MMLITLAIILLVLAVTIFYIIRPLVSNNDASLIESGMDYYNVVIEYKVTLNLISELKQEFQDGKVNEEDYNDRREKLNDEAAKYLQQIRSAN